MASRKVNRAAVRRDSQRYADTVTGTPAPLRPEFADYLQSFQPSRVPAADKDAIKSATCAVMERAVHIKGRASFIKRVSDVSALARWAVHTGRDLTWQALMDHHAIHDFARSGDPQNNESNFAHRVRRLELLASALNPGERAFPRLAGPPHVAVGPPYSEPQMRLILRACAAQRNLGVARGLYALVGFCRGAGASSSDLLDLRGRDVIDFGAEGIDVTLGTGPTRRTVPVRRAYEPWARTATAGLGPDERVLRRRGKNAIGHLLEDAEFLSADLPKIEASRLRTTWIAELMTLPIPLNVLLAAAGLKTARTLTDILPHLQQPQVTAEELLRGDRA